MSVCEAFNIPPSEAWLELYERNPAGWVEELIEKRQYRAALSAVQRDPMATRRQQSSWTDLVEEIEAELAHEELERRRSRRREDAETEGAADEDASD